MLNHVDLCSGIGGFSLGFEWAGLSQPILFCDIEPWARQILKKHWPNVPIAEDVKEIAADPDRFIPGRVDILTAGYPCQPFSVAGNQRGTEDPRHIYPYISRIVAHKRPTWCVFENVYGHVSLGLDEVLNDLEGQGYSIRPFIVPASAVNAPHKRDRLWIIARNMADTKSERHRRGSGEERGVEERIIQQGEQGGSSLGSEVEGRSSSHGGKDVAYTRSEGCEPSRTARKVGETQTEESRARDKSDVLPSSSNRTMADTNGNGSEAGLSGQNKGQEGFTEEPIDRDHRLRGRPTEDFWAVEPPVGRVAHGIPRRVDRLKGLGNAIVPQIAQKIGETILKLEKY